MPFVNNKTRKSTDKELVVFPGEEGGDPDGIGVLVDGRTGEVTNRWGDGTAGLDDYVRAMAADETDAFDPHTMELYVWKQPSRKATKPKSHRPKSRKSSVGTSLGGMR